MTLPTEKKCLEILEDYKVPKNIIEHSETVRRVAVFLARKLKEKDIDVNVELVDRAALLHDLDKLMGKDDDHGYVSEKILSKKGYPELGRVVVGHRFEKIKNNSLTWEEKLLNYSDKIVEETKIIPLKKRLDNLGIKYKITAEHRDIEAEKAFSSLEKEIFDKIGMKPEELKKHIKK